MLNSSDRMEKTTCTDAKFLFYSLWHSPCSRFISNNRVVKWWLMILAIKYDGRQAQIPKHDVSRCTAPSIGAADPWSQATLLCWLRHFHHVLGPKMLCESGLHPYAGSAIRRHRPMPVFLRSSRDLPLTSTVSDLRDQRNSKIYVN